MRSKIFMRATFLTLLIVALSLAGFTKEKDVVVESSWMATPIQVDGTNNEWNSDSLSDWKKADTSYAFANDANNLYILFIFKNPRFLSSVRHTGFTVWFNTQGKDAKAYGINFREKQVTADQLIARMEKEQGPLQEAQKQKIKQQSPTYFIYTGDLVDKKGEIVVKASLDETKELPAFRSKPVKGVGIVHEFKIPLAVLEKVSADYALEPGQSLKIGFEWGGFTREVQDALAKEQAARGVAARERAAAADSVGQERRDGSESDRFQTMAQLRNQAKKYAFWTGVKLAQEK
jgi:hypothetical protein